MMTSNQSDQTATQKQSRKEYKQEKKASKKSRREILSAGDVQTRKQRKGLKRRAKKARRRILPIWLRILIVLFLTLIAIVVGLMIGYGIIGDGVPTDALKKETWQHITDFIKQE